MRAQRLGNVAIIAAFAVGGAFAQQAAVTAQGSVQAQGELGVGTKAALTPAEQVQQADKIGRRATQLGERLTRMLDEARREKDILRANCVNRKLTEVNANARNVEQRAKRLKDADASGDAAGRSHEYTVLTVLSAKLESLSQEASQCLGESLYEPSASQVVTTVPVDAPTIDPSVVPAPPPPPPAVTVPPYRGDEPFSPNS
jgi:hypothetical protein